ncbi:hypothetical protein A2442_01325 [Candidatus Campbellbacteria bacterium RIFOXYC2_FULL_35_25]|uniref:DUF2914 domain-containing protein n=1 Tax=Candidatus Campbellbacteria bacterium RIFOXYC2_FULL_35_25 TaxID=1797582 RepID=A0A1F5EH46_9BACT|nr:MAG: hypothetical protein A2442_01325 [Candidatus Campbellbacteria bacterium RIFOXYC2_FULL_35_25]
MKNYLINKKERLKGHFSTSKNWVEKNDKYLSPAFFIAGFILDNLTLTRIDMFFDNAILFGYLSLVAFSIIMMRAVKREGIVKYLPFVLQFAFGGLFSGYVIFYTKSASLASSWIFLFLLYGLFLGNERLRHYYKKSDFQIIIFFVAIFSFMIFFIPVLLKEMGWQIFILSGLVSLLVIYLFIFFTLKFSEVRGKRDFRNILVVYIIFNILYFTNIIPPVPLSLKNLELYHSVEKSFSGNYIVQKEVGAWSLFNKFTKTQNSSIYVYSSVFAPTDLNIDVVNVWRKYDEKKGEWVTRERITYSIKGGRSEGYRGYSFISNVETGKWKVSIETERGQTLGVIKFKVIEGKPELETEEIR